MSNNRNDYCALNSIKSKIKAEDEKKVRGLSFAKLYFANKDYEKALTYLNEYLTVKSNSAEAYRVLGDIYDAMNNNEKSFEAYKKSYYIDKNENLLFKICAKLENLNVETQVIKVWLDRLEKKYPNHQSVFNLRDKLQLENGNSNNRFEDTFRDLSNVKLADLTDEKCSNLSCSFLNSRSSPALTPNQFKSLERSQDRLMKKVIEIDENFNKTTQQILELVKENHTAFDQLKNEIAKINSSMDKLQLEQQNLTKSFDSFVKSGGFHNDDLENEDEETYEEEGEESDYDDGDGDEIYVEKSDVFTRLGPTQSKSSTTFDLKNQDYFKNTPNLAPFESRITERPTPLEEMSNAISKIGFTSNSKIVPDSVPKPGVRESNQNLPLNQVYKDQYKGKWVCQACYCPNEESFSKCGVCETDRSPKPQELTTPSAAAPITAPISAPAKPFAFNTTPSTGEFSFFKALKQISPQEPQSTTYTPSTSLEPDKKFIFGEPSLSTPSTAYQPSKGFTFNSSSVFGQQVPTVPLQQQPLNTLLPTTLFSPSKPPPQIPANSGQISFVFGSQNTLSNAQPSMPLNPVFGNLSPAKPMVSTTVEEKPVHESAGEDERADGGDDPQIDFKPVIPMPPKINVITGEENEEVIFQRRAKLFRFADNEWKERGLGDIKILYDEKNSRYRLLMRREQIHKVCLNTPLGPDFKFDDRTNAAGNMLQFGCCDFSDGEKGKGEVLALKFKTKENADKFRNDVHAIVEKLGGTRTSTVSETSKKEESKKITTSQKIEFDDIEIVYEKQAKSTEALELANRLKLPKTFFNYDDVKCPGCHGCKDYIPKLRYELFSGDDEKENAEKSSNKEEANPENLFSSALLANVPKTSWTKTTEQPQWMKSNPVFSWNKNQAGGEATGDHDPEAEITSLDFKPLIPLPDLIEVKTGEEDEEVLFSSRAKLFKYTSGEWKERGLGEFKVLRHNQTKKIRFLMRREQVHKLCLNHIVDKNLKFGKRKDRETIYQWGATDFSDDASGTPSNFNIKFKTSDICLKLMKTLKENVEGFEETIFQ